MNAVGLGIVLISAYLLGSIPVGVLVGRLLGGVDPRREGSGRTGATNVLRTVGPAGAAVVLLLDIAKGGLAVLLATVVATAGSAAPWLAAAAGTAAVLGHIRSVFLGFAGGRGVATAAGGLLVMSPWSVAILAPVVVAGIAATRYVSIGSIGGALLAPVVTAILAFAGQASGAGVAYAAAAGALVIWAHADNIGRLRTGTERRLGEKAAIGGHG